MTPRMKNDICAKARLIYGLLNVLKYDVDNLRVDANAMDISNLVRTVEDTNRTLENITDLVAEIEYLLYLYGLEESL